MLDVRVRIRRMRIRVTRGGAVALVTTLAVAAAAVGAVAYEARAGAADRVSPPIEAAPAVLSTLPAAQRPLVEEISPPDGAGVDPKGGAWIRLTVPRDAPWATKDAIERGTYANWLGEVAAAGIQAQLLASGEVGVAGAIIQPAVGGDFDAGLLSDSFVMGTPEVGAYALPSAELRADALIADTQKRALAAEVVLEHIEVLSLGRWKAIAIVARSRADAEATAAAWYAIVRELLPIDVHDAVVGYYMALEDAAGSPVRINSTGYLANITSTWRSPELKADPNDFGEPVLSPQ